MAHFFLASDALKLVAVYSPKCGSQSIRTWCQSAIEAAVDAPVEDLDRFLVWHGTVGQYTDHWKVFFVRDPLRRLVGFYARWVVRDPATWCFADAAQRMSLRSKSFRQFLLSVQHLRKHRLPLQHHLVPQLHNTQGLRFDQVIAVERLADELGKLNRRFGIVVPIPHDNQAPYDPALRQVATDRAPDWLRRHGVPAPEFFYDDETRAIALEVFADDAAYYREATGLWPLGAA